MGKGSEPQTQTTAKFVARAERTLSLAMPGVKQFAAQTPTRYPESTVAGFDPSQGGGTRGCTWKCGRLNEFRSWWRGNY